MKITKLSLLAAAALGSMMVAPRSEAQTLTVSEGDLLVGFYMLNSAGTGVEANTYVFNLGAASVFRENTLSFSNSLGNLGNIGDDLDTAFGAGWQDSSRLRWGIFGGVSSGGGTVSGDPIRTVYYSQGLSSFSPDSTTNPATTGGNHGTLSNAVTAAMTGANGQATGDNAHGAIVSSSATNNYASFLPPLSGTYFGIGVNPLGSFGAGTIGTSSSDGGYGVEGALDMYRILGTTSGADLTAGLSTGNAALRSGQYIGTLTLDSAGNLRMDAVPEPSTYALMAIAGIAILIFRRRRTAADVQ